ncbi:MAG: hypothetical protein PHQ00_01890 [Phycisphaerae bacterium]|nr:hypothetical protein [Phycisphaerae bacterium]
MDMEKIRKEGFCRIAGATSGLLLAIPNLYPIFAPIQIFALLTIFYLGAKRENKYSNILTAGIYMGLFYTLPQMVALRLPVQITAILLIHLIVIMTVLTFCSAWLIRGGSFWGAFAVGAFLVVLDWINFKMVPLWGTAQSIVRPWSQYPNLIQFGSLTGITGIIFVLGTLQALIVSAIVNPQIRRRLLTAAIFVVLFFTSADLIVLNQRPSGKLKVAAIGWATSGFKDVAYAQTPEGFEELYVKPATKAASYGAKLIVSPEIGFCISEYDRNEWLEKFQSISSKYNVVLAVGYLDVSDKQNRLMYIIPNGKSLPEYSKTYLIPFFEDYKKGDGQLRIIDINGVSVGGMICQDDNFTQFSREYGRKKVSVVAVPTLDWSVVKSTHLQNSIHRAIESRYAIVRAAMDGISAIIAPGGKVLASCDHFKNGPAVIMAEVPIYKYRTLFSVAGHWPVMASAVFLVIYLSCISDKKLIRIKWISEGEKMETTSLKIRNIVFSSLIVIFIMLQSVIMGLGRYLGFGRYLLLVVLSLIAILLVLAIAMIVLTAKIRESKLRKTFFMLAGASAAAIPICAVLHNVVYGLFFHGKDGDEAVFFVLAVLVFPALFILSSLASIITGIYSSFKKRNSCGSI